MRSSFEAKALLEHQLLWAMPPRMPQPRRGNPENETAADLGSKGAIRACELTSEALQERETRTSNRKTPSRPGTLEIIKRRTQETAARKARNACLKSAAQLLPTKPPTLAIAQATWKVIAPDRLEVHVTQHAFLKARQLAKLAPRTSIQKRTLARCIGGLQLRVKPAPSGWRNGLWIGLLQIDWTRHWHGWCRAPLLHCDRGARLSDSLNRKAESERTHCRKAAPSL